MSTATLTRRSALEAIKLHSGTALRSEYGLLIAALVGLTIAFGSIEPRFLTGNNFINILVQSTIIGLAAIGITFVFVAGELDISPGAIAAFTGIAIGQLLVWGIPVPIAILFALLIGAGIGAVNGVSVAFFGLNSFIVTLAMMAMARGGAFAWTSAQPVGPFPDSFANLGVDRIGRVPYAVVVVLVVAAIAYVVLGMTRLGRETYAVGGNREAALLSGVRTRRTILLAFVISGFCAAAAGIVLTAQLNVAWASAAPGLEFQAITAVILGGASFFGGRGTIVGVCAGTLVIGLLQNGLSLLNVSPFHIQLVNGTLILLVVIADRLRLLARGDAA